MQRLFADAVIAVTARARAAACGAPAVTLRVANQGDVASMDPHSLNETLQLSFTGNIYEPLVGRDKKHGLVPALATKWTQTAPDGLALRAAPGVKFHDGTPFTADDVVFTLQARRRRRLGHEGLHARRSRKCARSTTSRSRSRPPRRSRSCPTR